MNARLDNRHKASHRPKHPELPYGIYWRGANYGEPYIVKFRRAKRHINIGTFCILEEAIDARDKYLKDNP